MADGHSGPPGRPDRATKHELLTILLEKEGIKLDDPQDIPPRPPGSRPPLSFAQESLWFLNQFNPDSTAYNVCRAMHLRGPLNVAALQQALREIVTRHENLRTTFPTEDGQPFVAVDLPTDTHLAIVDLQDLSHDMREEHARMLATRLGRHNIDLSNGPVFLSHLLRLQANDHFLILATHHIVCDDSSVGILFRELSLLYEAFTTGKRLPLPAVGLQYADFATWQRSLITANGLAGQLAYWKEQLPDGVPVLELPTDRPRPTFESFRGTREPIALSKGLSSELRRFARERKVTVFTALLAAFNVLLHRYTGQDEILVGFPVANRDHPDLENVVGFFVNTLVLRTNLSGNPTFEDLLERVRATVHDAVAHQDLPFEKLVAEFRLQRDPSRNPLFQVMLNVQNAPKRALQLTGLAVTPIELDNRASKFDLTVSFNDTSDELAGWFEYSLDLFDTGTVKPMVGHYQRLIEGVLTSPNTRIADLPILTDEETNKILFEWNSTADDYPGVCLHELVEDQATKTPDAIAATTDEEALGYKALNERANQFAYYLSRLGVGPDVLVGICVERSLAMLVGLLGILKAGGAYVPLDPTYPEERIDYMIRDSGIQVLVTQDSAFGTGASNFSLPSFPVVRKVCLDSDQSVIEEHAKDNLMSGVSPANIAYLICTSGSTGKPKATLIEHRNAVTLAHWAAEVFESEELTAVLASTSICFDLSIFELFVPLTRGGTVLLAENAVECRQLEQFAQATLLNTVPSAIADMLDDVQLPASLRTVNLAGEALKPQLVREIYRRSQTQKVFDLYGPSECTTYSTFALRTADGPITIGRAITNTRIYILDRSLAPVPVGAKGEIHIGGLGVARGYLNGSGLTAERFVPDPFGCRSGARMYSSGDLGRYRPDSNVEYLGRIDQQVKIRGYRVEPGEIETILREHPQVDEVAVTPYVDDQDGSNRGNAPTPILVAYLTLRKDPGPPDTEELRQFLAVKLPLHMLPSSFIVLDELPRTRNGKLDRSSLPLPERDRSASLAPFVTPRNPMEELVSQVWREVLGLPEVSVHDDFFAVGGHSLLATQIVSRLRRNFTVDVSLRHLFSSPTIARLAEVIEKLLRAGSAGEIAPIPPIARDQTLPLSFSQQRVWFLHQLDPELVAYNMPSIFLLRGELRMAWLKRAFDEVIRRHESLRTTFQTTNGVPLQLISPRHPCELSVIDLEVLVAGVRQLELERIAAEERRQVFDLTAGPLLRVRLLQLGTEEHALILNVHHMVCDGWSLRVLFRELAFFYAASTSNIPPPSELVIQYADFAAWQRNWLSGEALESQLSYWKNQLTDLPTLVFPADFQRSARQSFRGARLSVDLSTTLTGKIKDLSRQRGVTLFMTLLATLGVLVSRWSGQTDFAIGSTVAGRNRPELEHLIGFFINAVVLRMNLSSTKTFGDVLEQTKERCLGAFVHSDLPFERLVQELHPERPPMGNPLFQIMFNMQHLSDTRLELSGLEVERLPYLEPEAKFDLTLYAPEKDGHIQLSAVYNKALFRDARITALLEQFAHLLAQIVDEPDGYIHRYPLAAPSHRRILPDPGVPLDAGWKGSIHELFTAQSLRNPHNTAIVEPGENWTYGELRTASNKLAHRLIACGITPGDVVAIYARRSASLVCSVLGVLKAGAAFMILDPRYPALRLMSYLDMGRPQALLELEGTEPIPKELAEHIGKLELRVHLSVPSSKAVIRGYLEGTATDDPTVEIIADDPAYVAFTSGSTGEPKGVLGRHGPLTHFLPWLRVTFSFTEKDRFSMLSGLSFNTLHREMFTPLECGATIAIPDPDEMLAPAYLANWMDQQQISVVHLTPAMGQILQHASAGMELSSVRACFFAGDTLARPDVERIRQLAPRSMIVNFYGATETQRAVGYFVVPENTDDIPEKVPVGKGIEDVQLLVLNHEGNTGGIGELGEIHVRSPHLARGYLDDEETRERFLTNPFTRDDTDRLYKTGELGRYLPDGNVELVGRIGRQINIRGFRLDLGEVEAALRKVPRVHECRVLARPFEKGDSGNTESRMAAYVAGDQGLSVGEIRLALRATLPEHMIPSYFVLLSALPLNAHGKIDDDTLPAPESASGEEADLIQPETQIATELARIWCEVLNLERISMDDRFFDLGGHSLLATMVIARIRDALGVEVPVRSFLENPTVLDVARMVARLSQAKDVTRPTDSEREEFEV